MVAGRPCAPSHHRDRRRRIDMVAILVGDPTPIVKDAIAAKAKFAIVFAAGFSEVGTEGERMQAELEELIAASDLHVLGPNTNLNAFEQFRDDLPGKAIALVTQSGHQGRPVFQGQEIGIRLSHWAPVGNEADLEVGRLRQLLLRPARHRGHRLLRRGLQERAHPAAGRRPGRPAQGAGGGGQGRPHGRGHLDGQGPHRAPHRFGRRGLRRLPPVRGHPGRRARPAAGGGGHPGPDQAAVARGRPGPAQAGPRGPGLRLLHLRAGPAPTWPTWWRRPAWSCRR